MAIKTWPKDVAAKAYSLIKFFMTDTGDERTIGKISKDELKNGLAIEGIELDPVTGGATSAAATVLAPGPTGQMRKREASPGWYSANGAAPVQAAAGKRWVWGWNNNAWTLWDMGTLPKVEANGVVAAGNEGAVTGDTANTEFNMFSVKSINLADKTKRMINLVVGLGQGTITAATGNHILIIKIPKKNTIYSIVGISYTFVGNAYGIGANPADTSTFNSNTRVLTFGDNQAPNPKTQYQFNSGNNVEYIAINVGAAAQLNTVMLYEGTLDVIPAYQPYGRMLSFDALQGSGNIVTTQQINPTEVNSQLVTLGGDMSDIKSTLYKTEHITVGIPVPNSGNNATSSARTRIDNLHPLYLEGASFLHVTKVEVYENVAGPGKIKFMTKYIDPSTGLVVVNRYNVYAEISVNFVVGLNVFDVAILGANRIVPNNTFLGFFNANPSATAVALGAANSSAQFTSSGGDYLTNDQVAALGNAVIQFNATYEKNTDVVQDVSNKVGIIEATGVQLPEMFYKYDPAGNGAGKGLFTVYARFKANIYIAHLIGREINTAEDKFQDYYRYLGCSLAVLSNGTFVSGTVMFTSQESEFVWGQQGKVDFTGGYHGNEKFTDVRFYADNEYITTGSEAIALTPCKGFYYIEISDMFEAPANPSPGTPNPAHPKQATHTKITRILNDGYVTKNLCKWDVVITLYQYYSGIACVSRNLSTTAWSDRDYVLRDLDVDDNALLGGRGYREVNYRNPTTGLGCEITSKLINGGSVLIDSNQVLDVRHNTAPTQYKKYYRGMSTTTPLGPETVQTVIGETWISEMQVRFTIK